MKPPQIHLIKASKHKEFRMVIREIKNAFTSDTFWVDLDK